MPLLSHSYTWIGLNDLKNESDYQWSDGANLTYKSMNSQMDYMKDERAEQEMDCIASDQNGQWSNFHCDDKFYALCKKKLSKYLITVQSWVNTQQTKGVGLEDRRIYIY